jgi:MoaA/NifB/PqqE/SkfB family radical SAM enzyme
MDKRLAGFAKYARSVGFTKIYIHTNGWPLTAKRLDEWGEAGITDVNLSLSPKREFSETRPGIPVEKYFANIEKLIADKPQYLNVLSVDYIRTGLSNEAEEKEFKDWLASLNIPKRIDIELHNRIFSYVKKYKNLDKRHEIAHFTFSTFLYYHRFCTHFCQSSLFQYQYIYSRMYYYYLSASTFQSCQ